MKITMIFMSFLRPPRQPSLVNRSRGYSGGAGLSTFGWSSPFGFAYDSAGDLFVANSGADNVAVIAQSTGTIFGQSVTAGTPVVLNPLGGSLSLVDPYDVAFDSAGDLFIVNSSGSITVVPAAATTSIFGQPSPRIPR